MRNREKRWEEKKFKLNAETRGEWKVLCKDPGIGGPGGQRYGSAGTRYEVRGSLAEMTPVVEVAHTAYVMLGYCLYRYSRTVLVPGRPRNAWQRCNGTPPRAGDQGPRRSRYLDLAAPDSVGVWRASESAGPADRQGQRGLRGIDTRGRPVASSAKAHSL